MRVRWWVGPHRVTARRFGLELAWVAYDVALNVLVVYWLGQLAFPSLGLVPPTLAAAVRPPPARADRRPALTGRGRPVARPGTADPRRRRRHHRARSRAPPTGPVQRVDPSMSRILDGPAGPIDLVNARAPIFLRVVVDDGGKVDCLDQLEDSPAMSERIHVYEKVPGTDHGVALINLGGRKGCVRMATGDYRHRPDVDGEAVRETGSWREWCQAQAGHG